MRSVKVILFAGLGKFGSLSAKLLLDEGSRIFLGCRLGGAAFTEGERLKQSCEGFDLKVVDFSRPEEAEAFIDHALSSYGQVDGLVNFVSTFPDKPGIRSSWKAGRMSTDDWSFFESNFLLARQLSKLILSKIRSADDFSLINFGDALMLPENHTDVSAPYQTDRELLDLSSASIRDYYEQMLDATGVSLVRNPYALAKRDICLLTRALARTHAGGSVRANAIAPGPMLPPPDADDSDVKPLAERTLLKRLGGVKPIAQAVKFFLDNDYITGHVLPVGGGIDLTV